MSERTGIFEGNNPFELFSDWLEEAKKTELNDPNAIALASVDVDGVPNVRIVLLKNVEPDAFLFYTNYDSKKGIELLASGKAAFVIHWKSIHRQIRVRGTVEKEDGSIADKYFQSRHIKSRIGAWASQQSSPLESRDKLIDRVAHFTAKFGESIPRPPHWGGFRLRPLEIEFWSDGEFRLHDRYRWTRRDHYSDWKITRLSP